MTPNRPVPNRPVPKSPVPGLTRDLPPTIAEAPDQVRGTTGGL
jgi:hypothetical protein